MRQENRSRDEPLSQRMMSFFDRAQAVAWGALSLEARSGEEPEQKSRGIGRCSRSSGPCPIASGSAWSKAISGSTHAGRHQRALVALRRAATSSRTQVTRATAELTYRNVGLGVAVLGVIDMEDRAVNRTRRRQVHVWLTESEYVRLKRAAGHSGHSVAALVRELINRHVAAEFRKPIGTLRSDTADC
jgi:hypothetical protein